MSARRASPSAQPAAPLVINVEGVAAGFAVRHGTQFRFFPSQPRFDLLEGSRFSRLEDLQRAVKRLCRASAPRRRQGAREEEALEIFAA